MELGTNVHFSAQPPVNRIEYIRSRALRNFRLFMITDAARLANLAVVSSSMDVPLTVQLRIFPAIRGLRPL